MLKNLLNQTAVISNPKAGSPDAYGNVSRSFTVAGTFACRLESWKGAEFEFDRDTRRSLYKIMLEEGAAGVITGRSRISLSSKSHMGKIPSSVQGGAEDTAVIYEVLGDPKISRRRSSISHVEAILRTIEG